MASASDYTENATLNHWFKNTAVASPANTYLGLFTVVPTDVAGSGTEVAGNAYARQALLAKFAAVSGGSLTTNAQILYPIATPAGWGTIVAAAVFDAVSGGNMLAWASLVTPVLVPAGAQFVVDIGDLTLTHS